MNNVRHLYTEWEENPGEAIEMSKHRLSFPISAHHRFTPSIDSEVDSSSPGNSISSNNIASSCNSSSTASLLTKKETSSLLPPSPVEQNNNSKKPKEDSPVLKELTQKIGQQANDETDGQSASGNNEPVAMKPDAVADGNKTNKPICALTLNIETTKTEETIEEEEGLDTIEDDGQSDKKITPEELLLKQARVRESLKMQGVVSMLEFRAFNFSESLETDLSNNVIKFADVQTHPLSLTVLYAHVPLHGQYICNVDYKSYYLSDLLCSFSLHMQFLYDPITGEGGTIQHACIIPMQYYMYMYMYSNMHNLYKT